MRRGHRNECDEAISVVTRASHPLTSLVVHTERNIKIGEMEWQHIDVLGQGTKFLQHSVRIVATACPRPSDPQRAQVERLSVRDCECAFRCLDGLVMTLQLTRVSVRIHSASVKFGSSSRMRPHSWSASA